MSLDRALMRLKLAGSTIGVVAALGIGAAMLPLEPALQAQQPPPPSGGRGGGRGVITSPRNAYPERTPDDPAAVARGKALSASTASSVTAPISAAATAVQPAAFGRSCSTISTASSSPPSSRTAAPDRGMPKFAFTNEQAADVAGFLHTFKAAGL